MHTRYQHILCLATLILGLSACEDPIDVTLAEAEPLLVVDAWVDDRDQAQTIRVIWSQPYFEAEPLRGEENAQVLLIRDDLEVFDFSYEADGNYVWRPDDRPSLGEPGDGFALRVTVDGLEYIALAEINPVPEIDRIESQFRQEDIQYDEGYNAEFFARDIAGRTDAYWIKTFKNNVYLNKPEEINLALDAGFDQSGNTDGLIFIPPIRQNINPIPDPVEMDEEVPSPYDPGDTIRVELHSMSLDGFTYMGTIQDQLLNSFNGIFALPLINTEGNIFRDLGNDELGERILGHFNIASVSSMEHIVQE